jgi:hypothetical protein
MYKITNIDSLGTNYTVSDQTGNVIKIIQVITQTEILEAALGKYTEDFGTFQDYIQKSIAVLAGFEQVNPNTIMWYATLDDEVVLSELIQLAINTGYDKIILEHLEEVE